MNMKEVVISAVVGAAASLVLVMATDALGVLARMTADESFASRVAAKLATDEGFVESVRKGMPRYSLSTTVTLRAEKRNNGGTATRILAPTAGHACFLQGVQFEDLDSGGESAECLVTVDNGNWVLNATLSQTDDHDAVCHAACVSLATE